MDPDFMKNSAHDRPFSPAPERSIIPWLASLILIVGLLYLGYQSITWWRIQPTSNAVKSIAPPTNSTPPSAQDLPQESGATPAPEPGTRLITKCVVQGKTSYGDSNCATGAVATQVVTKANHNLLQAVRVPPTQTEESPSPSTVIAQSSSGPNIATIKAECAALDEHIKYLDALARQPQSGQMQDWIRGERKKARDRQFGIPCS
ncbi:MAG: hypothetical protein V4455_18375 [Pseudomonadota bacterium]